MFALAFYFPYVKAKDKARAEGPEVISHRRLMKSDVQLVDEVVFSQVFNTFFELKLSRFPPLSRRRTRSAS
jgi:hypothetical protein